MNYPKKKTNFHIKNSRILSLELFGEKFLQELLYCSTQQPTIQGVIWSHLFVIVDIYIHEKVTHTIWSFFSFIQIDLCFNFADEFTCNK